MAKFKLEVGDIFTIPLGNGEFGFGQVITEYKKSSGSFMIGVFNFKSNQIEKVSLEQICNSELVFLGFTFDAKLYHKDWLIIGVYLNNIPNIILPYYKLGLKPDDIYITDYKGDIVRIATDNEFSQLSYKTEIAPIRYENALKAFYNLQEWIDEDYNKILYKSSLESNVIANRVLPSHS